MVLHPCVVFMKNLKSRQEHQKEITFVLNLCLDCCLFSWKEVVLQMIVIFSAYETERQRMLDGARQAVCKCNTGENLRTGMT